MVMRLIRELIIDGTFSDGTMNLLSFGVQTAFRDRCVLIYAAGPWKRCVRRGIQRSR